MTMYAADGDVCGVCERHSDVLVGACGHQACKLCWKACFALGESCGQLSCDNPENRMLIDRINDQSALEHSSMQDLFGSDCESDDMAADPDAAGDVVAL
jgi:hypothetical protein